MGRSKEVKVSVIGMSETTLERRDRILTKKKERDLEIRKKERESVSLWEASCMYAPPDNQPYSLK